MGVPVDPGVANAIPVWVPDAALNYLRHTECGKSLRHLARRTGLHASTVLRQVRKLEARRDDLLVDLALDRLGANHFSRAEPRHDGTRQPMIAAVRETPPTPSDEEIEREARRLLRRLSEPGACLAVAKDMDKAVVVRDAPDGQSVRTAVLDRPVAEAMALKDWISCEAPGRISRYRITGAGRAALKRLLAEAGDGDPFGDQHREMAAGDPGREDEGAGARRMRYNMAESPLVGLSRRRDKDGRPFLSDRMVAAGERLREDFELAQMGPRVAQNWDRFLTGGDRGVFGGWRHRRGARRPATGFWPRLRTSGRGSGTSCCAAAASSKGSRRQSGAWAGRRGRARSCCASRFSGSAGTTTSAKAAGRRSSARSPRGRRLRAMRCPQTGLPRPSAHWTSGASRVKSGGN